MNVRIAVAGALLAATGMAGAAEISATATLTNDYDWRGVTQTRGEPAFQLGLNYGAESGIYMGIWGSNVKFGEEQSWEEFGRRPSSELDLYLGWGGGDADEGFGYDVGGIYYSYPNAGAQNFPEVYAGVSMGMLSLKGWYSWDYFASGDTAAYADANLDMPMASGFSFLLHMGYSFAEYHSDTSGRGEYLDWSAGVGYNAGGWTAALKYVDGSDMDSDPRNLGRFVFSLSTTLGGGGE